MISSLSIRGLAVVGDVDLELGPGFTVLTGETGTGKTMLLHAIALLRGQKPDVDRIAAGAAEISVEASFRLPAKPAAADLWIKLEELDAVVDDGEVIVRRVVRAQGRSSANVGGRSVPTTVMAEITDELIAIHGQHSARLLAKPDTHRRLLDGFAGPGHLADVEEYGVAHRALTRAQATLASARSTSASDAQMLESARTLVSDWDAVGCQPGEDADLKDRARSIQDLLSQQEALRASLQLLAGGDDDAGATTIAGQAERLLLGAGELSTGVAEKVREALALLHDASSDLLRLVDGADEQAMEYEAIERRRAEISALLRRYSATTTADLLVRVEAARELIDSLGGGLDLESLEAAVQEAEQVARRAAEVVSQGRIAAATALAARVNSELTDLAFAHAGFGVLVTAATASMNGHDAVEFVLATRANAPAVSLATSASGGEMSRVSLALTAVTATSERMPALVFDEVDAGIGGQTAHAVAGRLARLAEDTQVIAVTHLPQVAAAADRHWVITSTASGSVLARVESEGRIAELCRMMGTDPADPAAAAVAEGLLQRVGVSAAAFE